MELCGCGWPEATVSSEDSALAQETLVAALEAWKSGTVTTLAQRDPPIRFVDDDCRAGIQLAEFELEQPDTTIIPHKNVKVSLTLRDRKGQTIERIASYQVGARTTIGLRAVQRLLSFD